MYWGAGTLAESNTSGTLTSEYIYLHGRRIAQRDVATGNVYYYFADELGSSNVVATATGALENESDFYPFGGESVVTQNLTNQHYKFESKERDPESGLDNFGARFSNSNAGRFMSPDWASSADPVPYAELSDPQSLNLYAFAQDNPESAPDIDGHFATKPWDSWWSGSGTFQNPSMCDFGVSAGCDEFDDAGFKPMGNSGGEANVSSFGGENFFKCSWCHDPTPAITQGQKDADRIDFEFYTILSTIWNMEKLAVWRSTPNPSKSAPPAAASAQSTPANPDPNQGGGKKWKWGSHKTARKAADQMADRGWTDAQIDEAVNHGTQYPAPNRINPANGATR